MAWPSSTISTVNMDAATDSPAAARPDIKQIADNLNTIQAARGASDGIASTDPGGKVPTGQLPTIPANQGGTGQTVYNVGDILFANTTTTLQKLTAGALGAVLTSGGPGAAPSWQASNGLGLNNTWTGTNTFNGQVVLGSTLQANGSVGTSGQTLVSRGVGVSPTWTTPPGTLIGTQVFTASGTYNKSTNNPSYVEVEIVGGGSGATAGNGGSAGGYSMKKILGSAMAVNETVTIGAGGAVGGGAGGTTSFGSHFSATGGNWSVGNGGVGVGGDVNIAGGDYTSSGTGGASYFGGGRSNNLSGGAPGSGGSSTLSAGRSGLVIVREYA